MPSKRTVAALAAAAFIVSAAAAEAQTTRGFEGFYIGAHAGYGKLEDTGRADIDGALGGLHGGYNYMLGALLLGAEADYDWSDVSYTLSNPLGVVGKITAEMNYYASVRGRLGWAHQNILFYATAGYSWSELEASVSLAGLGSASRSVNPNGFVGGGGLEYRFSNAVSARIEGLHYRGEVSEVDDEALESNVIRAGFSYHLP